MKKNVLILGAGIYQVPLIKKAKELGHKVIVTSIPGHYPGFRYADRVYYEDTTHSEKILKISEKEHIDAICTLGTDVAIRTIGYVCDQMNLTGVSANSAILATDKRLMKEAFEKEGVNTPKFRTIHSLKEAYQVFEELDKPVVFKSVDRSGSKGVSKVDAQHEIENAYRYAMENTYKEYILVEEFIDGKIIGAEAAVVNGKMTFLLPNGDILYPARVNIPVGHFTPSPTARHVQKKIEDQLNSAVTALQLDNCAINADLIVKDEKVYVIEIGARGGGTNLADLVCTTYDFDYYKYILDISLGKAPSFDRTPRYNSACQIFYSEKTGNLEKFELLKDDDRIVSLHSDYRIGDHIEKFKVGTDRIGHIVIKCERDEDPLAALEEIKKTIVIRVA